MTERDIFLAALDLPDPAARAAHLDMACGGDAALRARVESLLRSHDTAGSFLGAPAVQPPAPDASATQELGGMANPDDDANKADDALTFLTPPGRADSFGRIGHYEVLEVLGRGGFGIVFRAFDETLQRVVAVKVLDPHLAATSPARKRFLREARSSARVRHENVVQVYAVEEQPLPYLVMEFIPGETLQQRLDRMGPLETAEVVQFGRQIAEGLAAAYAQGLIHRDIKPANILIEAGPHPHVKITDFGLARAADDASLTQSGLVAGTPMFMAPEQAQGETLDHRADLFSLGSVLYTMCSGRPPFRANSTVAVLKRVAEDTPRPIPEIIPEAPPWLCEIITRLHAKKPEDRIGTAREVADLLGRGLEKAPPPREVPQAAPATRRPRFRTRRWAAAAAVLLLLAVGSLGFTEATGVTDVRGTVIRLFSPEGTLEIQVDDPDVSVQIDGSDLVITGAGAKEIRLKPGSYTVKGVKDGKVVSRELVTVTKDDKQVVRVSQEAAPSDGKAATQSADASAWEHVVAALSAAEQVKAVGARLKELNPGFNGAVVPTIEDGVVTGLEFKADDVKDVSPVRVLTKLRSLKCSGSGGECPLSDLSPLSGLPLTTLWIGKGQVSDLSPLKGMPLTDFRCNDTPVSDLSPLKGMKLTYLDCAVTKVSDLSPLNGMPLQTLVLSWTKVQDLTPLAGMKLERLSLEATPAVSDLSPLRGMKLTFLWCPGTKVSDLSPLNGMPLEMLNCGGTQVSGAGLADLKDCKNLTTLKLKRTKVTAAGFDELKMALPQCKIEWDGGVIDPASKADAAEWERSVAAMPAADQVKAVSARLKELNPGFDGKVEPTVENGVVTGLQLLTDAVDNIAPLRALKGLVSLDCPGTYPRKGKLSDLSPLKGMSLKQLNCCDTQVAELTAISGMPLTNFNCSNTRASHLAPLKGMPLVTLHCANTGVRDLSPLKGMKLESLEAQGIRASDLTPLQGMPLKSLDLYQTKGVANIQPLQGMPLEYLNLAFLPVSDLSPLKGMTSLRTLVLDDMEQLSDLTPLKGMPLALLDLEDCRQVRDLEALQGMPLKKLQAFNTGVTDLKRLQGMPLEEILLTPRNITQGLEVLRDMKSLKTIGVDWNQAWPAAEFWQRYDKGEFKE